MGPAPALDSAGSSEPAPDCRARLAEVLGGAEERLVPVVRDGRALEHRIVSARR